MRTPKAKGAAAPSTCKQKVKAKASPGRSNNKGASTPSPQQTEPERRSTPNTRASAKQCKVSDINSERTGSILFDEDESKSLKRSRQGKNKMEEYSQQTKFCYTAQDVHEEFGLSLEGKLPKDLTDEDLPPEQWLTVFKYKFQKNSKIYLNHLQPHLVEDCRFLFSKVYQGPPSCGELTSKFARCYAYEKCHAAKKDPAGHRIAWARFGEGVLQMIASRSGGLDRKVEAWRRQNGSVLQSVKKPRMTQSGSNILTEPEQGSRGAVADYLPDLEALLQRLLKRVSHLQSSNLTDLRASIQANKDQLLVYEGKQGVAKSLMEDISTLEERIDLLRKQIPIPDEEIKEVEVELTASRRLLQRHGVSEKIQKLQAEVQQQEVL